MMRVLRAVRTTWWLWRETKRQMPDASLEERTKVMRAANDTLLDRSAQNTERSQP